MGTFEELVGIIDRGELADLLAETFGGEKGVVKPGRESDFMVAFVSEALTPDIGLVCGVVCEHFANRGFRCQIDSVSHNSFTLTVFTTNAEGGCVTFVVTTNYPLTPGEGLNNLRVTTRIID